MGEGRGVARALPRGLGAAEDPGSTSSANETRARAAAADLVIGAERVISFRAADKELAAAAASCAVDGPQEVANGGGEAGRARA